MNVLEVDANAVHLPQVTAWWSAVSRVCRRWNTSYHSESLTHEHFASACFVGFMATSNSFPYYYSELLRVQSFRPVFMAVSACLSVCCLTCLVGVSMNICNVCVCLCVLAFLLQNTFNLLLSAEMHYLNFSNYHHLATGHAPVHGCACHLSPNMGSERER